MTSLCLFSVLHSGEITKVICISPGQAQSSLTQHCLTINSILEMSNPRLIEVELILLRSLVVKDTNCPQHEGGRHGLRLCRKQSQEQVDMLMLRDRQSPPQGTQGALLHTLVPVCLSLGLSWPCTPGSPAVSG